MEDRPAFERIDKNLNTVDKQIAETGMKVKQMTFREYCMKLALYIAIFVMFAADIIVLLLQLGVFWIIY